MLYLGITNRSLYLLPLVMPAIGVIRLYLFPYLGSNKAGEILKNINIGGYLC